MTRRVISSGTGSDGSATTPENQTSHGRTIQSRKHSERIMLRPNSGPFRKERALSERYMSKTCDRKNSARSYGRSPGAGRRGCVILSEWGNPTVLVRSRSNSSKASAVSPGVVTRNGVNRWYFVRAGMLSSNVWTHGGRASYLRANGIRARR